MGLSCWNSVRCYRGTLYMAWDSSYFSYCLDYGGTLPCALCTLFSKTQTQVFTSNFKSKLLLRLNDMILVFLKFIFILISFVKAQRSPSWCWSTDWSGGRIKTWISCKFGGPLIRGAHTSNFRHIASSKVRSSTYFFLMVRSLWWHRDNGQASGTLVTGPLTPLGRLTGWSGQEETARMTWRSKSNTLSGPPRGPPPGIYGSCDSVRWTEHTFVIY